LQNTDDKRSLTSIAVQDLGMEVPEMQFSSSPQYMLLEMVYNLKRQVQEFSKVDPSKESYFTKLAGKFQAFTSMLGQYTMFNETLQEDQKVNYHKKGSDFIKPIRKKQIGKWKSRYDEFKRGYTGLLEETSKQTQDPTQTKDDALKFAFETPTEGMELMSIVDPESIGVTLQSLYTFDKRSYNRFMNGFVKYADYLLNVAARKKIGNITIKDTVKDPVLLVTYEFKERAKEQNHEIAQKKLVMGIEQILSGEQYQEAVSWS
jgi:hypothetical protein